MVLYHAISIYQLLTCICLQINHHKGQDAICILPDFIVNKYPNYKQLESCRIFRKVVLFPYSKMPVTDSMEIIGQAGDSLCRDILPCRLVDFEEIYCGGTHFAFASYLVARKIHFNYLEDASGIFLNIDDFRQSHFKEHTVMYRLTEVNGLYDGSCPYVKHIYADVPEAMCSDDSRVLRFNALEEIGKFSQEDLRNVRRAFGVEDMESVQYDDATVLLTDAAEVRITLEEQIRRNKLTVDYFCHTSKLIIKPHPDDWICHGIMFEDAVVLPRCFPIELMGCFMKSEEAHAIAYSSAVLRTLHARDLQSFDWPYQTGEFTKIHRYYAAYSLYRKINISLPCRFEMLGGNRTIFENWAMHDNDEVLEYGCEFGSVCLFVGDSDFSADELAAVLNHPGSLVIMDKLYEPALELLQGGGVSYLPKAMEIISADDGALSTEYIHVLTSDAHIMRMAENFSYSKSLKYTRVRVEMKPVAEGSYHSLVLQEVLKVREAQLLYALQEREQMRSML